MPRGVQTVRGVSLIGADCEIFIIHCTCPIGRCRNGASSDGSKFFGSTRNWIGDLQWTRIKDLNHYSTLLEVENWCGKSPNHVIKTPFSNMISLSEWFLDIVTQSTYIQNSSYEAHKHWKNISMRWIRAKQGNTTKINNETKSILKTNESWEQLWKDWQTDFCGCDIVPESGSDVWECSCTIGLCAVRFDLQKIFGRWEEWTRSSVQFNKFT